MKRQQATLWVWWLLPVLVARALLPVGYMLDVAHSNPAIIMCGESGLSKVDTEHPQSSTHAVHHAICPFALALSVVPPVALSLAILDQSWFLSDAEQYSNHLSSSGPARINFNRGPPAYS